MTLKALTASYDSRCTVCDDEIRADVDEIVCLDDEWVHAHCAIKEGEEVSYG